MHTQRASSPTVNLGTAAAMIGLMAAGAVGVSIGGPQWGLLGAALVLFCVDWAFIRFQYDHGTDEIERYYNPPLAVRAAGLQRTRSLAQTPLAELESQPQ